MYVEPVAYAHGQVAAAGETHCALVHGQQGVRAGQHKQQSRVGEQRHDVLEGYDWYDSSISILVPYFNILMVSKR